MTEEQALAMFSSHQQAAALAHASAAVITPGPSAVPPCPDDSEDESGDLNEDRHPGADEIDFPDRESDLDS